MPRFNGMRWDGSSSSNSFTVIASHFTDPVIVPNNADIETDFNRRRIFGTSALAGHWESQIGGALRIGTTFVNTHRFDSEAGTDLNGMRGTVPRVMHGGLRKLFVFVTDDNPRTEDPELIRRAILAAIPEATEVADRAEAILRGVDALGPGDVLLIAGKGHETGQTVGDTVYPFDDVEQASVAIAALDGGLA